MSAKYELQDILRIRDRRKDAAETALLKAKQALREAEQFLKEQQDKEADFIQKKPKFIQRIYELALEKIQFRRNYMDIIAFKLGKLEIPPELLGRLMQMDMSPENLEKLQKLLDFVFDAMPQPKDDSAIEEEERG